MIPGYQDFKNLLKDKNVKMQNEKFNKTMQKFDLVQVPSIDLTNQQIQEYINKSKVIIMDKYTNNEIEYVICCINSLIMIINPSEKSIIQTLYSTNKVHKVPKYSDIPKYSYDLKENFVEIHQFYEELDNFNAEFGIKTKNKDIKKFWSIISPSIAAYLIKKSYLKTYKDRINEFIKNIHFTSQIKEFKQNEFIELRRIDMTCFSSVSLYYHIENEKLYAIKTFMREYKLREREINNYRKIKYPFIPKYYGKIKDSPDSLIIEYINGQTLSNINKDELDFDQKVTIIIELLHTFQYLHNKNFIYRDLKPNNLILDKNQHIVLIDFDRMINIEGKIENEDMSFTVDFNSEFFDPKITEIGSIPSIQNDIYSIGKFISFIFNENSYSIKEIVTNCLKDNLNERPSLSNIIMNFENLGNKIKLMSIIEQIVTNQNDAVAQNNLGNIYYEGEYIKRNINKSIYYLTLAANQNNPQAQNSLGNIYYRSEYIKRDINKSIHYLTLAANQNNPQAQFNLGNIYYEGEYIERDINKAIYYLALAVNQNNADAQNSLGNIYYEGKYVERDINKSIFYFSNAADQNYAAAQTKLGDIYYEDKYIKQDINKSIYYYSLAANQNDAVAQINLGDIYYEGKYIKQDINKSIYYYSLAANQNYATAQTKLGDIYYEGKYIKQDINKSIYYYSLAANQNDAKAQTKLGDIYYESKYIKRDINKAIYYYSLAANQNNSVAQNNLSAIYSERKYIKRDYSLMDEFLDLSNFSQQSLIGKGSYGDVYKVKEVSTGKIYAAKISKFGITGDQKALTTDIKQELSIISRIEHPSILKFIGYSPKDFSDLPRPVIVTEYASNGSLLDIIDLERRSLSPSLWNDTQKLITLYGISSAMSYMHEHNIIHPNLKPENILEDEFLFPMVADFGLSKIINSNIDKVSTQSIIGFKGTPVYVAPEIWMENGFSKASNVYSFAIIAYEILSLEHPFENCTPHNLCFKLTVKGERPKFNKLVPECYKKLIEKCWDQDPKKRPSFEQIKNDLKNNEEFLYDGIDKEKFYNYVEMIDNSQFSFEPQKKFQKIFLTKNNENEKIDENDLAKETTAAVNEVVENRERKIEVKEVCHHKKHSVFGESSRDHTHFTIYHITRKEQRTLKTDCKGNKVYTEWTVVPGTESKQEVGGGMERGFTQGYEHDV